MAKKRSWRDRTTVDGRSWQTRQAADSLVRALREHPFRVDNQMGIELAHALMGHRASISDPTFNMASFFNPKAKLDTTMIDDRRWVDPFPWDARVERPAPTQKVHPRNGKAGSAPRDWPVKPGRHDPDRPAEKPPLIAALAGDGRLERPAPRYGQSSRDDYAGGPQAGTSDRPRIQQHAKPKKKPKKKPPPRFNQGRHDG